MLQASGSSANAPLTKLGAELLGVLASVMQLACALSGCIYGAPDTIRTCDLCLGGRGRQSILSVSSSLTVALFLTELTRSIQAGKPLANRSRP